MAAKVAVKAVAKVVARVATNWHTNNIELEVVQQVFLKGNLIL